MNRPILVIILFAFVLGGCSGPPPAEPPQEPGPKIEKASETARIIFTAGADDLESLALGLLDEVELPVGKYLEFVPEPEDLLPKFYSEAGHLSVQPDGRTEELAKRIRTVLRTRMSGITPKVSATDLPNTYIGPKSAGMLISLFLFHELGRHIALQYKLIDGGEQYEDYFLAWQFAAAMLKSLDRTAPELPEFRKTLVSAISEPVKNAPEKIRKAFSPESAAEWFTANRRRFTSNPSGPVIAFHLGRIIEILDDDSAPDLAGFVKSMKTGRITAARSRIKLSDAAAKVRIVYEKHVTHDTRQNRRLPRGIHTLALGPEGRFYFGRRGSLATLRQSGQIVAIVEGRQSRFNPVCFASPKPGSIVFFEPGRRISLDLEKKKIHITPLDYKTRKKERGDFPLAIDESGTAFVDTGGQLLKISAAGEILARFKVSGITGGLALTNSGLFRTNMTGHTVEVLDPSSGKWTIFAGVKGIAGHRDGRLYSVAFNEPCGIAAAPDGSLYIADRRNHSVRKITPDGEVETVAGLYHGTEGDNTATFGFNFPCGIAISKDGTVYIAEEGQIRITAIGDTGKVPDAKPFTFPGMEHRDSRVQELSREIRDLPFTRDLYTAFISRAHAFASRKEFDSAITDLRQAIELEPDLAKAYLRLAKVHVMRDSAQDAVKVYNELIAKLETLPPATYFSNPDYFTAHLDLARTELGLGNRETAVKTFRRALDLHRTARRKALHGLEKKDLGGLYLALGIFAVEDGDQNTAVRYLTDASKYLLKNPAVYTYRGAAYLALDNTKKAFKDLRQARLLDTRYPDPHLVLAKYYDGKKDFDIALFHFRRYVSLGGKDPEAKTRIDEIDAMLKERESAAKPYTEQIEEDGQARLWRIRKYADGTEERILIDK